MLDRFFIFGDLPLAMEKGSYQLPLVVLSYIVASFASYTALALAQQLVSTKDKREKTLLHWGGAFAMGAGIWSMHFIGMLSYKMRMKVEYDPLLTFLSMLIAIGVAYGVLSVVARVRLSLWQIFVGAVLLGFGICAMHYTGMTAMEMDANLYYIPSIFSLSVIISIGASAAALWISFTLPRHNSKYHHLFSFGAALVMGAAICGMHYTGMWASVMVPFAQCRYDPNQNFDILALSVAGITSLILGLALATGIYKKSQTEFQLAQSETRLRAMIDNALDAVIGMNQDGQITEWNKQAEIIFGWSYEEALGRKMEEMIIPPEYREAHRRGIQRFLTDGTASVLNQRLELVGLNKQGKRVPLELTVTAQSVRNSYQFTAFIRDITDRKQAEAQIKTTLNEVMIAKKMAEDAQKKAEVASRSKSEFLANMSHEIRTPLSTIIGISELLGRTAPAGKQKEYTQALNTAGNMLLGLVNNILDLSKIEAGEFELLTLPIMPRQLMEEAIQILSGRARENHLTLTFSCSDDVPLTLFSDPLRLKQILLNLVSNAVKFSTQGTVSIRAETLSRTEDKATLRFSVEDNGPGIPADKLNVIFEKFTQLGDFSTKKYAGTGLGLAICKRLVERMGGKIGVNSTVGKGSVFWFEIEFATKEPSIGLMVKDKRVMVIDASFYHQRLLVECLTVFGLTCDAATSVSQAAALLAKSSKPYHLLFIDQSLPEMNDQEMGDSLRSLRDAKAPPMVLITSLTTNEDPALIQQAGFIAQLARPVSPSEILNVLTDVFGSKHLPMTADRRRFVRSSTTQSQPALQLQGKVLLVEDYLPNRQMAKDMLEIIGCEVGVAGNGEEALERMERDQYDVILMDCQMPEMDGFQTTAEIRKREKGRHAVIIAMTANALQGDRERCLKAGMDDYIGKPVRFEELSHILIKYLAA